MYITRRFCLQFILVCILYTIERNTGILLSILIPFFDPEGLTQLYPVFLTSIVIILWIPGLVSVQLESDWWDKHLFNKKTDEINLPTDACIIEPEGGRLYGMRCYLSGAIDQASDRGETWRDEISKILKTYGVVSMNPLKKPIPGGQLEIESSHYKLKEEEKFEELRAGVKQLRAIDLRMLDVSDFVIVYIDSTPSCGTWEEVFKANYFKKPVLIVSEGGIQKLPSWVFGAIPIEHMFNTFVELAAYLHSIDNGYKDETGRWIFLNYKELC